MMTSIINVLSESLKLLRKRPALFVPKLVTAIVGALWFVGFISGYGSINIYLATAPLIGVIGLFGAVMLAGMVKEKDSDNILRQGFVHALHEWKGIVYTSILLFALGFIISIPVLAGLTAYYMTGQVLWLFLGVLSTFVFLTAVSFLLYFFPISLIEEESFLESMKESTATSVDNSLEVVGLTLLSFTILGIASAVGDSGLEIAGYAGFVTMRAVSGIITTYVFVVSPEYYLSS